MASRAPLSRVEVLRRLPSIDGDVPVIMVSSHGTVESVRAAMRMRLGAFDYPSSPLTIGR
jgi:DNA-binding NtrC family response regulator